MECLGSFLLTSLDGGAPAGQVEDEILELHFGVCGEAAAAAAAVAVAVAAAAAAVAAGVALVGEVHWWCTECILSFTFFTACFPYGVVRETELTPRVRLERFLH